jgi:alpha-D-ribose 1-methylphosphonate 5-triphosphate diphosphatase PhnM
LDYAFMGMGEAPGFKLISLKEHQIWENQFHELNTYEFFML